MKTRGFAEGVRDKSRSRTSAVRPLRAFKGFRWIGVLLALIGIALSFYALAAIPKTQRQLAVLVATRSLVAGQILGPGDLAPITISSDTQLAGEVLASELAAITGKVVTADVAKGSIISNGELVAPQAGKLDREISFAVPASHALGTALSVGDRIDVLSTAGNGATAVTTVLGRALKVDSVSLPPAGLGSPNDPPVTITVACPDSMTALAIANGAASATLWIDLANSAKAPDDSGTYQVSFSG